VGFGNPFQPPPLCWTAKSSFTGFGNPF